jgi:hypothetical protein
MLGHRGASSHASAILSVFVALIHDDASLSRHPAKPYLDVFDE